MFARSLALLTFAFLTSASHLEGRSQCDTGSTSCCSSVQTVNEANNLLSILSLVDTAVGAGGLIGLTCTSIVGGCTASQEPVCCSHNEYNGLVNVGCSPINLIA